MTVPTIASWLLTYLVHSTILLGMTWFVSRALGNRQLQLQETLLRIALIAGLLTTGLQLGTGLQPLAGAIAIDASPSQTTASNLAIDREGIASTNDSTQVGPATGWGLDNVFAAAFLVSWFVASAFALLVLCRSIFDLRRLLHTRRFRPAGRIVERLARTMGLRHEVRLSTSKAIAVPFATGIRKPEICCPERVCELAEEHRTSLFAHELAHIARRDPAWQLLYRVGEAVLFLQPLNRLVRGRLEEIAEHLTDERAIACTGNRLGLARCLVVLAHWGTSSRLGIPATAFAAGPRLDRRVSRLLEGKMDSTNSSPWAMPFCICVLAGAALILPAVVSVSADSATVIHEKTWSTAADAPADGPSAPQPPDVRAPEAPLAAPEPEAVPAPAAIPDQEAFPQPAAAPAPSAEPAPVTQPVQPTPPAPATPPSSEEEVREEHARERAERVAETRERAEQRARHRAQRKMAATEEHNERACRRARDAERVALEHLERARQRAVYSEERRLQIAERAAHLHTEAEFRSQERAVQMGQDPERIKAHERQVQERSIRMEIAAERRADEARARNAELVLEREKAIEARARELAEQARRIAEEAEIRALENRKKAESEGND